MKKKKPKKTLLELMRATRVRAGMNTGEKIIGPQKGKGSYSRKAKHKLDEESRE